MTQSRSLPDPDPRWQALTEILQARWQRGTVEVIGPTSLRHTVEVDEVRASDVDRRS